MRQHQNSKLLRLSRSISLYLIFNYVLQTIKSTTQNNNNNNNKITKRPKFIKFQGVNMRREIETDSTLIERNDRFWVRRDQINLYVYRRYDKKKQLRTFQQKYYEFPHLFFMFTSTIWSLSWLYKPANLSKSLVGTECWYAMIVCLMCIVWLVYQASPATVKTSRRQKNQLLVCIVFHVLPLFW